MVEHAAKPSITDPESLVVHPAAMAIECIPRSCSTKNQQKYPTASTLLNLIFVSTNSSTGLSPQKFYDCRTLRASMLCDPFLP
jgi:hypothetical protein